jgi:NAD(P)-dependent dehydrogenase (short-subunit alcohol dehydrogenase family)
VVVAITGGARGIGRATAEACLRAGHRVAIADLDLAVTEETARAIGAEALQVDVTDRASFAAFLDGAEERLGPLDVLINNAGIFFLGPFAEESPEHTDRQVAVNVLGVMTGTRLALDRFLPRRAGHIVNIASSAGLIASAGGATYSATKHAVVGLTRALRGEIRDSGVKTTIVMPGIIRTDMIGGFAVPRGIRTIGPEVVAEAIVEALRTGRQEVIVPRETTVLARLAAVLPPRAADGFKRALKADRILAGADRTQRTAYERRIEGENEKQPSV